MSQHHPTLLEQFRSFCYQNKLSEVEQAIDMFAVFGGTGWSVDALSSLDQLIETKVLANYRYIHGDISKITQSNKSHHALLSAVATGDGREYSAFKRAGLARKDGEASAGFLIDAGILRYEASQDLPLDESEEVSGRLYFISPFMRFWFAFISPYYKSIRDGDYAEFRAHWSNEKHEFLNQIYELLVLSMVQSSFVEDPFKSIGSYWDKNCAIDIFGQTSSGKVVAGVCKLSKSKANKSELTKLNEKCENAKLRHEISIIFSKGGFSNEFKKEKSDGLRLYSLKSLKILVDNLSQKDLITFAGKKY